MVKTADESIDVPRFGQGLAERDILVIERVPAR